ncbi:hypothetical protein Dalk_1104 [Desulfatibacillum aliphaticivorans]|uniref:Uncharacterized protein n=1 Tax=Desulfatibacillum aliphaticivorans TaxID=218208 RepID=B8F961_DESAL|nr:hypothetical protein Dalk_1104 [Desulfatibacillum aliphaticivorans]
MVLAIRIVLTIIFSVVLMRLFRPEVHLAWGIVLGCFLLGIVYIREHFRKKQSNDKSDAL